MADWFISWLLPLIAALIGAFFGGVATYLASYVLEQQKREAEAAILRKDEIYSPIYRELVSIINTLRDFRAARLGEIYPFALREWKTRRDSSSALHIPRRLRHRLEDLLQVGKSYRTADHTLFEMLRRTFPDRHADQDDYGVVFLLANKMLINPAFPDATVLDYLSHQGRSREELAQYWTEAELASVRAKVETFKEWKDTSTIHAEWLQKLMALQDDLAARIQRIVDKYQSPRENL